MFEIADLLMKSVHQSVSDPVRSEVTLPYSMRTRGDVSSQISLGPRFHIERDLGKCGLRLFRSRAPQHARSRDPKSVFP